MTDRCPRMVISGAQTGVDRGALIAAMQLGYESGGWVPLGRKAEDGLVPTMFHVTECSSDDYRVRTRLNIECADATLILSYDRHLTGGSRLTQRVADELQLPWYHVALKRKASIAEDKFSATRIRDWISDVRPTVLNVAGQRESKAIGIQQQTVRVMSMVLRPPGRCVCGREIPKELWDRPKLRCSKCGYVTTPQELQESVGSQPGGNQNNPSSS